MTDLVRPEHPSRVLLTGSEGRIGRFLKSELPTQGFAVRGLDSSAAADRADEIGVGDLRDLDAVRRAMSDVDAVVHAGAIPYDHDDASLVMATNVMGTWNVLEAAMEAGVSRVVCFSSINAQGSVNGLWPTEYLPIDDDYPHHPMTPYQLSKHLVEEMCRSFSERHGMVTLCLRPVWVTDRQIYDTVAIGTAAFVDEWRDDYWAYVDVRDIGDAVARCLRLEGTRHDRFLLAASDTSARLETGALLEREFASVPWRGGPHDRYFAADPYRSLIDCRRARDVLGWEPRYSWRDVPRTIVASGEE